jgi:hypothetical protein
MRSTIATRIALVPCCLLLTGLLAACGDEGGSPLDVGGDRADTEADGDVGVDLPDDDADAGELDADASTGDADAAPDVAPDAEPDADAGEPDADATPDAEDAAGDGGDAGDDVAEPDLGGDAAPDADADLAPDLVPDADATTDLVPDADATPDLAPDVASELLSAVHAYYTSAPNWNDWVEADGTTIFDASDVPCLGVLDARGIEACVPGGWMRAVTVYEAETCAGVSASDALGAFEWACYDGGDEVQVVSTGLRDEVRLADILDFEEAAFLRNAVTVTWPGGSAATARTAWWANDVVRIDDDLVSEGVAVLENVDSSNQIGTVFLLDDDTLEACIRMNDSKSALVIHPDILYYADCADAALERVGVVSLLNVRYGWVEGGINADGPDTIRGLRVSSARYTVVRHVDVFSGLGSSIAVIGSDSNLFEYAHTWGGFTLGLGISDADYNTFRHVYVGWPAGVSLELSRGTRFEHLTVDGTSVLLTGIRRRPAFAILEADGIVLSEVTILNSAGPGLHEQATGAGRAGGHVINNLTVVNSAGNGVMLEGRNILVQNLVVSNSGDTQLLQRYSSENNTIIGAAIVHGATWGIQGEDLGEDGRASDWFFSGPLLVGDNLSGDCQGLAGSGILAGCANDSSVSPASNAALVTEVTLANAFVGPVASDAVNPDEVSGPVPFDEITDFVHFENEHRGWSPNSGRQWPFPAHRGACEGANCRVFDWSLVFADTVLRDVNPEPTGSSVGEHFWVVSPAPLDQDDCDAAYPGSILTGSRCRSVYLRSAAELLGDHVGNDNGLCESNEDCLYTPNLGAYQGHGPLVPRTTITSGAVTGMTLYEYLENGR